MRMASILFTAIGMLAGLSASQAFAVSEKAHSTVYFRVQAPDPADSFVIALTDRKKIAMARRIVSGKETNAPHVSGALVKMPAPYNKPWGFYLDPKSISFFHFGPRYCNLTARQIQADLDHAPPAMCPWGASVAEEIPPAR